MMKYMVIITLKLCQGKGGRFFHWLLWKNTLRLRQQWIRMLMQLKKWKIIQ